MACQWCVFILINGNTSQLSENWIQKVLPYPLAGPREGVGRISRY